MRLLTEAYPDLDDPRGDGDIAGQTRAAQRALVGVHFIPRAPDVEPDGEVIPGTTLVAPAEPTLWVGEIPSHERYLQVEARAKALGLPLLNSGPQHLLCTEFDLWYPALEDLTAKSAVVRSVEEVDAAVATLGLPLFVKGAVQSRKFSGFKACVGETVEEVRTIVGKLLSMRRFSRDRAVLRQLLPLRRTGREIEKFPLSREFRLFLFDAEVVGEGYYWAYEDPFGPLEPLLREQLHGLAKEAARRLSVPYLAVDIAQQEDLTFVLIEVGDPQFSGLSHIPPGTLWSSLSAAVAQRQLQLQLQLR